MITYRVVCYVNSSIFRTIDFFSWQDAENWVLVQKTDANNKFTHFIIKIIVK